MPRKTPQSQLNVVRAVMYSEMGLFKSSYRHSLHILNTLVKNKSTNYEKIWCEKSNQPITYEDSKIYLNNFTSCMALCGKNSLPTQIYKLPKNTKLRRFVDVFIYSGPVYKVPLPRGDYRPYFIALTTDNWIIRLDNTNGKILQEIYLGSNERYNFHHINWETQGETFVLQSVLHPCSRNHSTNGTKFRVVQSVAVFSVRPIKFIALFEIDEQQFGKNCTSANISEGLLILAFGTQIVRYYSLNEILNENNRLFEANIDSRCADLGGKVGQYPFGLPLNYKIKSVPPALFEVRCGDQSYLHFGGYPYHYLSTPPNTKGIFEVRNVQTSRMVENGRFDFPSTASEIDTLTFHTDDSGRLVYESVDSISFYKFHMSDNNKIGLRQQFELKLITSSDCHENGTGDSNKIPISNGSRTSTRETKKISYAELFVRHERSILASNYENELDLFVILGIDNNATKNRNGKVNIYDNQSGKLLHEINLNINIDEMTDYEITMDLDTIVITSKLQGGSKFECFIYRMVRDCDSQRIVEIRNGGEDDSNDAVKNSSPRKKRRKKARKYY